MAKCELLSGEEKKKFWEVLKKYKDIFSKKPGRLAIYEHELKMSTMDMTSSFWQIPLAEESKKYTAFLHEGKCYEFCVTPFGLKTSTAALVRALDFVLNGLGNFYLTFIDDIFCASENVHQHLLHLELLFHRLMENNLKINLEKSHFFRSEVKFLGHVLTSTGIKPDPEKIETIQNFSRPRNLKELRGFLGLINFYTKFQKIMRQK